MPPRYSIRCSIGNCIRPFLAKGLCGTHYQRLKIYGNVNYERPKNHCSIKGCLDAYDSKNYCGKHAQRMRRYGNPFYVTADDLRRRLLRIAQPKLGKLKRTTYKKYLGRHEHRQIAEQMLGRPLLKGEIVHHQDHNKHNNDPSNLEVMTQREHINRHRVGGKLVASS